MELCFTIYKYGPLEEYLTSKVFHDTKGYLTLSKNRSKQKNYFKLKNGEKVIIDFSLPWKKSIAHGITIVKTKTTIKEFKPNLNELERSAPDNLGKMPPFYVGEN